MSEAAADAKRKLQALSALQPVPATAGGVPAAVGEQLASLRATIASHAASMLTTFESQDTALQESDHVQLRETVTLQFTRFANDLATLDALIEKISESGNTLIEEDAHALAAVVHSAMENGGIDYGSVVQLRASIAVRTGEFSLAVGEFIGDAARDITVRLNYISQNVYPQLVQREDRAGLIDQAMRNQIQTEEKSLSETMSKIMHIFHNGKLCDDETIHTANATLRSYRDIHRAVNHVMDSLPPMAIG